MAGPAFLVRVMNVRIVPAERMASQPPAVIVLAAGLGKRFKSKTPKALHRAAGRPLIQHVLRAVQGIDAARIIVVVGHGKDRVMEALGPQVEYIEQTEQLGTGDAVRRCEQALKGFDGSILVLPGDGPLITTETLRNLVETHEKQQADATLLTVLLDDPTGYGRIIRNDQGEFERIVEEADAGPTERPVQEVSTGNWCFRASALFPALAELTTDNAQGEYYLPDAAWAISAKGGMMYTSMADDPIEVMGVNDRAQLAEAGRELRARWADKLMASGVTIEDPANTYIDDGVEVGADTIIRPGTFLEGNTRIGAGCLIGPMSRIVDSAVGDRVEVSFSVIVDSEIADGCRIGPYTHIRPETRLAEGVKAGSFVELKKANLGEGSKVPHLAYLGDADVGRDVNIGAGTITGNYDTESKEKGKTSIADGAFTGSNTVIVAPRSIGEDAGTGAGAVVTKDIPAGEIFAGIPAKKLRKRKPKNK